MGTCQNQIPKIVVMVAVFNEGEDTMDLGAFSVSLAVKDIAASMAFYQKLGFTVMGDYSEQGWAILKNEDTVIGLFQGMFEKNMLTFNPGWNADTSTKDTFEDIRSIQKRLKDAGLDLVEEADEASTGPAHLILIDPDGNPIMLDQHVPAPAT